MRWRFAVGLIGVAALLPMAQCSKGPAPISHLPKEQALDPQRPPVAATVPSEAVAVQDLSTGVSTVVAAPMDPTQVQFDDPHAPCNDTPGAFENQKDKHRKVKN